MPWWIYLFTAFIQIYVIGGFFFLIYWVIGPTIYHDDVSISCRQVVFWPYYAIRGLGDEYVSEYVSCYCICEHQLRDHEWNFSGKAQPCSRCGCKDFRGMSEEEEDALIGQYESCRDDD